MQLPSIICYTVGIIICLALKHFFLRSSAPTAIYKANVAQVKNIGINKLSVQIKLFDVCQGRARGRGKGEGRHLLYLTIALLIPAS